MCPPAEDNYGVDACSVLRLDTSPPVIVMATCDGQLHHCIILPSGENEQLSKVLLLKFYFIFFFILTFFIFGPCPNSTIFFMMASIFHSILIYTNLYFQKGKKKSILFPVCYFHINIVTI